MGIIYVSAISSLTMPVYSEHMQYEQKKQQADDEAGERHDAIWMLVEGVE